METKWIPNRRSTGPHLTEGIKATFPKKLEAALFSSKLLPTESQHGFRSDCHSDLQGTRCAPLDGLSTLVRIHPPPYPTPPAIDSGGQMRNWHPQTQPWDGPIHWGGETETAKPTGQAAAQAWGCTSLWGERVMLQQHPEQQHRLGILCA